MNEAEFERQIVDLATIFGWRAVGHRPMRTKQGWATGWKYDGTGWPDLTLIHDTGKIIVAELKIPPNKLSAEQQSWKTTLETCANNSHGHIEYHLWTPGHFNDILRQLSHGKQQ
jgi:hypothetical protein